MPRLNHYSPGVTLMLLINRLAVGAYFTIAGINKLKPTMTDGVGEKLSGFANHVAENAPLPEVLGLVYGYALPFAEILCGILLIVGMFARPVAWIMALMVVSFIIGATGLAADGQPFHANVIMLALIVLLAVTGPGAISLDAAGRSRRRR